MTRSKRLATRDRLYPNCKKCKTKLGEFRLDGQIDGENMSFCSFKCHDDYVLTKEDK